MPRMLATLFLSLAVPGLLPGLEPPRAPSPAALTGARYDLLQLRKRFLEARPHGWSARCFPRACEPGPFQTVLDRPGGWCEGVDVDGAGNAYTSDQVTEIVYRITPGGAVSQFARLFVMDNPGARYAGTLGLKFSRHGDLWIATLNYLETEKHGIYRVRPDGSSELAVPLDPGTVPAPDGLEFDPRGNLFIAEVMEGGLWKVAPGEATATLWLSHDLLAPPPGGVFGANGLVYKEGAFYVTNTDQGTLVKVPVRPDGSPGEPRIVVSGLQGPDGIILGPRGEFLVACSYGGQLVRIDPSGTVEVLLDAELGYPTTPAFGKGRGERLTVYLTNFLSAQNGIPSLRKVDLCP